MILRQWVSKINGQRAVPRLFSRSCVQMTLQESHFRRIVAGGTTIPASGYYLEPVNDGPPYTRVESNLSSQYAFAIGATTGSSGSSAAATHSA